MGPGSEDGQAGTCLSISFSTYCLIPCLFPPTSWHPSKDLMASPHATHTSYLCHTQCIPQVGHPWHRQFGTGLNWKPFCALITRPFFISVRNVSVKLYLFSLQHFEFLKGKGQGRCNRVHSHSKAQMLYSSHWCSSNPCYVAIWKFRLGFTSLLRHLVSPYSCFGKFKTC